MRSRQPPALARAFLICKWRDREAIRHQRGQRAWLVTCHCTLAPHSPPSAGRAAREHTLFLVQSHCCLFREQQKIKRPGLLDFIKNVFLSLCPQKFPCNQGNFFKLHTSSNSHAVWGLRMDEAGISQDLRISSSAGAQGLIGECAAQLPDGQRCHMEGGQGPEPSRSEGTQIDPESPSHREPC